ncbi:MAG TPA: sigma-70 family RNA polymerase sigma factor [Thermomicrobiales bacterium]|nr:sigma-70 family RNA polymerase sigma factor [Thermomicrobiales bacterium]
MAAIETPTEQRTTPPVPDDAELAQRIANGDAEALAMLYDRYSRVVYSFSMRILAEPGAAEELTQEVFIRIWRQGGQYQHSRGAFLTWVLSITHNMAIDEIRRRKRRPLLQDPGEDDLLLTSVVDLRADVEGQAWLHALRQLVREALDDIPVSQRTAIELAYFSGLTQREIAERLGEPLGTIKTRMRLGLLKLRDRLGSLADQLESRSAIREAGDDNFQQ